MTNGCTFCNAASKAAKTRAPPHCCRSSATPPSEGARTPTILDGLRVSVFEPKSLLPRDASCGLQVLLGTDLGNRPVANAFARGVALRFWRLGTPLVRSEPLIESYQISGLGAFNRKAATGPYWLAVAPRTRAEVVLSVSLLDGFFTTLVLQQDGDGIFNIYQTVVSRKADGPPSPSSLRRLEEVERLLVGGNRTRALDYADGLITSGQIDPMSGWMGAQLLFVNNRFDALDSLSRRLLDLYPKASDTHALRGAYLATRPDRLEEANTHFDKAPQARSAGASLLADSAERGRQRASSRGGIAH